MHPDINQPFFFYGIDLNLITLKNTFPSGCHATTWTLTFQIFILQKNNDMLKIIQHEKKMFGFENDIGELLGSPEKC
jgi:hypothetical protein